MTWKKTWFSYLLWVLYTVCVCVFVGYVSSLVCSQFGITGNVGQLGVIALVFCIGVLVFSINRLLIHKFPKRTVNESTWLIIECLVTVALIAVGVLLRMSNMPAQVEGNVYYEWAKVVGNNNVEPLVHGALYYYVLLLNILFSMVGNKIIAGIVLQAGLQMIAAIILYLAIRKIAGALPAVVVMAGLMLSKEGIKAGLEYSPHMLYLCLYAIGLYFIAFFYDKVKENELNRWYNFISICIIGIIVGAVTYVDFVGITLLGAIVGVLWLKRCPRDAYKVKGDSVISFFVTVIGIVIGFFCSLIIDMWSCNAQFQSIIGVWKKLYEPTGVNWSIITLGTFDMKSGILYLLVSAVLIMGIFGFFVKKNEESYSGWILLGVLVIMMSYQCLATSNMNRSFLIKIIILVLSGISLQMANYKNENLIFIDDILEESGTEEKTEGEKEEHVAGEDLEEPQKVIKFIDNPLPLPKKHIKKTMDYKIDVMENMMCFDIEPKEKDDYDI